MKRLLTLASLMLAGCGAAVDHGVVVGKEFRPAHATIINRTQYIGKTPVTTPMVIRHDDAYVLTLDQPGDPPLTGEAEVTKARYESVDVGDAIDLRAD